MNKKAFKSAAYCAAIGDALGVPWEFQEPRKLPPKELITMSVPAGFRRSHSGAPEGTWSDDTAMMLALADSLFSMRPFSEDDFAKRLMAWYDGGRYTPDGRVFDIGVQTQVALRAIEAGVPWVQAAPKGERDNGCGSLVRALAAAFTNLPCKSMIELAMAQSTVTHGHERSQLCCAIYALLIHALATGLKPDEALQSVRQGLGFWVQEQTKERLAAAPFSTYARSLENENELIWSHLDKNRTRLGNGYVLDTLWSAWQAFTTTCDVESCLREAVSYGHDTDSVGFVAGGLAGAYYGPEGVPHAWLAQLRGREVLDRHIDRLLSSQACGRFF